MIRYIFRRLVQSAWTVLGVMVITFLLFRAMAGDIAAAHKGRKATLQERADWLHMHGYDRPLWVNYHRRLLMTDRTQGDKPFFARDVKGSKAVDALALIAAPASGDIGRQPAQKLFGRYVPWLSVDTPLGELTEGHPIIEKPKDKKKEKDKPKEDKPPPAKITFLLADAGKLTVDITGVKNCGELIQRINDHPENKGRVEAGITEWSLGSLVDSQFFDHLYKSVTFQARSLTTNEKLTEIIVERAPASLAITVPAMALGWVAAMVISCFVAYFRGTLLDKAGVFLSVLGMCVPFLAFMIYGQWLMFEIAPARAYGLFHRSNVYVPIVIMVVAGMGASVRFYRTVILDQVNSEYVRTARAKGAPLTAILFKHVLKNCMLPILTNLVLALPFLIMGSLLVETYFGIPGLGDLLLSSITNRDEPIINALVFLTAVLYTVGVLVTDITYAVFDPRIRLG